MTDTEDDFVRPTTHFWQTLIEPGSADIQRSPPFREQYPATLPDGRFLMLPLRVLPDRSRAVASLIANQASFEVVEALSMCMSKTSEEFHPEVIVGLPTLGLAFAPLVANRLGHKNYVPMGYSRKFWYSDELSIPVRSITSPGNGKSLFLDPNIVPRLAGKRVVVVDDALSTGTTMTTAITLLRKLDCTITGVVVAMLQGVRWQASLNERIPEITGSVRGAISAPLFSRTAEGWVPLSGTLMSNPNSADQSPI